MGRVEAIVSHHEDSPAHQTYKWGHELEANKTASIAARLALRVIEQGGPYDKRFLQLVKLTQQVGARTCQELRPATRHFSYVGDVLTASEKLLDRLDQAVNTRL